MIYDGTIISRLQHVYAGLPWYGSDKTVHTQRVHVYTSFTQMSNFVHKIQYH